LCIGGPLATAIMRISLRRILSRFRLTVVPGADIAAHVESTMLMPTNGMPMRIDVADERFESTQIRGNLCELVELVEAPAFCGKEAPLCLKFDSVRDLPRRPK
jgi:hypothetical protein